MLPGPWRLRTRQDRPASARIAAVLSLTEKEEGERRRRFDFLIPDPTPAGLISRNENFFISRKPQIFFLNVFKLQNFHLPEPPNFHNGIHLIS